MENACEWGGQEANFGLAGTLPAVSEIREIMEKARYWSQYSHFIGQAVPLQASFLNYGFRVVAREKEDAKAIRDWQANDSALRHEIRQAVTYLVSDLLLMDNAVAFWTGKAKRVIVVPPERCTFTDVMGIPKIKIRLNWSKRELEAAQILDPRYLSSEFEPDPSKGEYFQVIKRARTGYGFAVPSMFSLLRTLDAHSNLEVGDQLWSFATRRLVCMWKIGHEIRNGPRAGHGTWFYNSTRAKALKRAVENKLGHMDVVVNFDTESEYLMIDPKVFAEARYEGLWSRIRQWLGPLGMIMQDPQAISAAMIMYRTLVADRRAELAPLLEKIVTDAFVPPKPVVVRWSNQCFNDPRIAAELMKIGLSAGPVSQWSFANECGLDPEYERSRKSEEAKLAESEETAGEVLPIFSPAHGKRPGQTDPSGANGRPAGTRDGGNRG